MRPITSFRGRHAWLSNFYSVKIEVDGLVYPTVEHALQASKTSDLEERRKIQAAKTPGSAKRMGRKVTLAGGVASWDARRLKVMEVLLVQKFSDSILKAKLLATGDAELVEGNEWSDKFWGVYKGEGQNWMGKLLMKVRTTLR